MKYFKKILVPCLAVLLPYMGNAIGTEERRLPENELELHIGEKLPDVVLNGLLNAKERDISLSQFKGRKALLIDFFATWCVPCVRELPKLNALADKFNVQLAIIAVSNQARETVAEFLKKNQTVRGISLPFVAGDRKLQGMFPHVIVPHEVWIDKNGIIQAISSDEMVTDNNVRDLVSGKPLHLPLKKDMVDFNEDMPLFKNGNGGNGNEFTARSILTNGISGIGNDQKIDLDSNRNITRIVSLDNPMLNLFYMAYSLGQFGTENYHRIFLETKDSAAIMKVQLDTSEADFIKSAYNYEYIPAFPEPQKVAFRHMFEDINRYFNVYGEVEKRIVPCWVITRTNNKDSLLRSKGGHNVWGTHGRFRNLPIQKLAAYLNICYQVEPVLDETGYSEPVDLDIGVDIPWRSYPDTEAINAGLRRYGLRLSRSDRSVDVLVIRDKPNK